jgi:hypothetical protein
MMKLYRFRFEYSIREEDMFEIEAESYEEAENEYDQYIQNSDFEDVDDLGYDELEPRPDENQMTFDEVKT